MLPNPGARRRKPPPHRLPDPDISRDNPGWTGTGSYPGRRPDLNHSQSHHTMTLPSLGGALRVALLTMTLAAGAQPACAHFLWLEPDPVDPAAARACFGEYPTLRERAPLLERIRTTRVSVPGGAAPAAVPLSAAPDHYRAQLGSAAAAPVALARLEYGLVRREGQPPFFLRYQAALLRGEGPLAAARIAELLGSTRELPLAVTAAALPDGSLRLVPTLEGKPVRAEAVLFAPGAGAATALPGGLELTVPPGAPGRYYLRLRVQDETPVRTAEGEGRFTRTYLSVVFDAAGTGAAAQPEDDAAAVVARAQDARAVWPEAFPGFSAEALFEHNGRAARGRLTVSPEFQVTLTVDDPELAQALRPGLASLIGHRRPGAGGRYAATWRDNLPHPLGRAITLHDGGDGFYRIRDNQIMQINRDLEKGRFTTNMQEYERTPDGRFLPRAWTVAIFDEQDRLVRFGATRVTWTRKDGIFLPALVEETTGAAGGTSSSRVVLTNHVLGRQ